MDVRGVLQLHYDQNMLILCLLQAGKDRSSSHRQACGQISSHRQADRQIEIQTEIQIDIQIDVQALRCFRLYAACGSTLLDPCLWLKWLKWLLMAEMPEVAEMAEMALRCFCSDMLVTMLSPFLTVSPVLPMTCARVNCVVLCDVLCDVLCLGVVCVCVFACVKIMHRQN